MKYYIVGFDDGFGDSGFLPDSYSNREAAQACADWHNNHPAKDELQYRGYFLKVFERIAPDALQNAFVPPMTEDEYQNSLETFPSYYL